MSSIKSITKFDIFDSDIDVNILKLDNTKVSRQINSSWEKTHSQKKGHLNKFHDWKTVELQILGQVDAKSKCDEAILKINCDWTNFYNQIKLNNIQKNKNEITFSTEYTLNKNLVSSEVTFSIDFLNKGKLVGESKRFSVFVDTRIKPDIDSSQFTWIFSEFDKDTENEIPAEYRALVQKEFNLRGHKPLSFFSTPDSENKLGIHVNLSFPGLDENLFNDNEHIPESLIGLRDLLEAYYRSNAYMVQFTNLTFLIQALAQADRKKYVEEEISEDELENRVVEAINNKFDSGSIGTSMELVNYLSSLIFPKEKNEKRRVYDWWKYAQENQQMLIERFNLSFQTVFNPLKKLNLEEMIEDLMKIENSNNSDSGGETIDS